MTKKKFWGAPPKPENRFFHWTDHASFNPEPPCRTGGCSNVADSTITDGFQGFCTECAYLRREHNEVMLIPFGGVAPPRRSMNKMFPLYTDEELGIGVPDDRLDYQESTKEMAQVV